MAIFGKVSCDLLKMGKSEPKTPGDIFADKRLFTDKPPINTKNDTLCYTFVFLVEKDDIYTDKRFFTDKPLLRSRMPIFGTVSCELLKKELI